MISTIKEIQALYDEQLNAVKTDLTLMLEKLIEHEAIDSYKILGPRVMIQVDLHRDIVWDNEEFIDEETNEYEAIRFAHQFVMGMYAMFSKCAEIHAQIVNQIHAKYAEKAKKEKNLIITPGSSLL